MNETAIDWPPRIELARLPTPVTLLERFSKRFDGLNLWLKRDELTGMEVSGNKIRKLEFSIAQALADGCDALITFGGVQSNHCRSTAILGARLGLKVYLILRGTKPLMADGNLLLGYLAGAEVSYLSHEDFEQHEEVAREIQQQHAQRGSKAFVIPIGASDEIGLWGYIAACQELKEDFSRLGFTPEYIVTATGSGGTQGGLILGKELFDLSCEIVSFNVCDDEQYFKDKITSDIKNWNERYGYSVNPENLSITTIDGYVGAGYGKASAEVFATIRELSATEGIFLDPVYTGKAFHGMLQEIEKGRFDSASNILFIHTGGLYGLFPQKHNFKELLI